MRESESININESLSYKGRIYYSIRHLKASDNFAEKATKLETSYKGKYDSDLAYELNSYVTSVIFTSVAFLEANINEIISDFSEENFLKKNGIHEEKKFLINNLSGLKVLKGAILEKYEILLVLLKNERFLKGESPFQDVIELIKLRNALVHYEPEWIDWSESISNNSKKSFHGLKGKFKTNPLYHHTEPFFPQRCLSAECAVWAVKHALLFTDKFCSLSGLIPTYEHIREELSSPKLKLNSIT